ncbi:MAG: phytanoyl-CoA dioxygenase family protein [Actinomycetota bacterium]
MRTTPNYDDQVGWVRVPAVLPPEDAAAIAAACAEVADGLIDLRPGDKPHGATRRLTALEERVPEAAAVARLLAPVVDQILPAGWTVAEVGYRCPGPGTGGQQLHADDLPRLDPEAPPTGATAIVALVPFNDRNGSTRVVPGSHHRVDQQRRSQRVAHLPGEKHLTGAAGTAFVFSRHLLHGGSPNRSTRPRPALQITYHAT